MHTASNGMYFNILQLIIFSFCLYSILRSCCNAAYSKILFHEKKNVVSDSSGPEIYKPLKKFDSQTESASQEWHRVFLKRAGRCPHYHGPAATAADSETPCVCDRPSDQPKLCWSAALRARPLILRSKSSLVFWNSLPE